MSFETLGFAISLVLSLMVFSYLLGDNFLFRLAVSIFVGLTAAYTTIVTFQSVIYPAMQPFLTQQWGFLDAQTIAFVYTPATLAGLLLLKPIPQLRPLTNFALAFLIAVGAAVAVVGAVGGTIIPLVTSTGQLNTQGSATDLFSGIVLIVGVATSLFYFQYRAQHNRDGLIQRGPVNRVLAAIGEGFIVVTLGAIYGAAILTSLSILTGQIALLLG
jgi:hypothetical protein